MKNVSAKELLEMLPACVKVRDFDGHAVWWNGSETFIGSESVNEYDFHFNLRKMINEETGKTYWRASYDRYGYEGIESSYPKVIKSGHTISDGAEDPNLRTALGKVWKWLESVGRV